MRNSSLNRHATKGSALVEFALVAFAFYLLVAAVITFGQLLHSAQIAQDAARAGARELALMALPPADTFEDALKDPDVRERVFDPHLLVVDLDDIPGPDLESYVATWPVVNKSLRPAMILDLIEIDGTPRRLMRFPGALIEDDDAPSGLTVAVPLVVSSSPSETRVRWVPVVEEVRSDPDDPTSGPFSVTSAAPDRGLVALRINMPYQSAAMASYASDPDNPFTPNGDNPNIADDGTVVSDNAQPGPLAGGDTIGSPAYSGPYGLGTLKLMGTNVRPFRRVVTAQAFFRREVFDY